MEEDIPAKQMFPATRLIETPHGRFFAFVTDTGVSTALIDAGIVSPEIVKTAVDIIRANPGALLVDIGAHIGTFSIPVSLATGCHVHAFEAQPAMCTILSANFRENGLSNVRLENVVLGRRVHPPTQAIPQIDYTRKGNFGAFAVDPRLKNFVDRKVKLGAGYDDVKVAAIDEYQLENIGVIKLDVEGAELDILDGARETLERNAFPPLIFESFKNEWWAQDKAKLLAFVESLGYELSSLTDVDYLARHKSRAG